MDIRHHVTTRHLERFLLRMRRNGYLGASGHKSDTSCIQLHTSNAPTNFEHPTIMRSWVMGDSIWSHYHHAERSLRMRRVTWPITGRQKWLTFLKSLIPICLFTLSLLRCYTTKIKPCYRRKIAFFPIVEATKSLRMRSITWPAHEGSPQNYT